MAATAPYGSWKSPISSSMLVDKAAKIGAVQIDGGKKGDDAETVFWTELRPSERGRSVVCSKRIGESEISVWTPQYHNARTRVHEYGGGSSLIHNGSVFYSNFAENALYQIAKPTETPQRLTPLEQKWRFADGRIDDHRNLLVIVREDHNNPKEVVNTIVAISLKDHSQHVLVSGADFYSSPRISPDGKNLCWVEWNHPNMPWDTTTLWTAQLNEDGSGLVPDSKKLIAGGKDESVVYPDWSNTNRLTFISDRSNWWNLYQLNSKGETEALCPKAAEFAGPQWVFGDTPYAFIPNSDSILVSYSENGNGHLAVLDPLTKELRPFDTGFMSHSSLNVSRAGIAFLLASDPKKPSSVVSLDLKSGSTSIIYKSRDIPVDEGYLTSPRAIEYPTTGGLTAHGYFYPPKNKDFSASENEKPPLLVKVHGGPTAACSAAFNMAIQYWTSRGFAILDVNYGGSTGFGREYRERLKGNWGIVDVDDCCNGALHLSNVTKEVDINRLAIDGGSAGGFTTLAVLAFRKVFKAGCSNYGVSDLEALAQDTHKFESRYLDGLVGKYPEEKQLYKERSPIHHVDGLNCPIILFQGDEDAIVPPNQAEMMFEAVKKKGLPVAYVLFQGEQHGFRKAENICANIDGEFHFFAKVFGFTPAEDLPVNFKIHNLQ